MMIRTQHAPRHTFFAALLAALPVVLPAMPARATARLEAPFAITFMDRFAITACPATAPAKALCATGHGSAAASHLGSIAELVHATAVLAAPDSVTGCAPEFATVRFTAAGGRITLHLTGQFCPTGPATSFEVGYYLITGGTGRFSGAAGRGAYQFSGMSNAARTSGAATHTYQGTITL